MKFVLLLLALFSLPVRAGTLAQFRTVFGDIEVELYDQDKPVTVQNFLHYVRSGAYQNMFLHRCVPGFVIQGGGFSVSDRAGTNDATLFSSVTNYGTITNEFNVGTPQSNVFGTIAMAKLGGDPNSASSQWFFNLADNSTNLDNQNGGFTVFGRVVRGTNVLNQVNNLSKGNGVVDLRWWFGDQASTFSDLPVDYTGFAYPQYADLIYLDVSPLNVQVRSTDQGAREISWNSVSNKLNHVEFTTNLPPWWQTLISTNGTGNTLQVVDDGAVDARRFYRVRVEY